jgi:hypothetical protein
MCLIICFVRFLIEIKKQLHPIGSYENSNLAIFMFVDKTVLPPSSHLMSQIYEKHRDAVCTHWFLHVHCFHLCMDYSPSLILFIVLLLSILYLLMINFPPSSFLLSWMQRMTPLIQSSLHEQRNSYFSFIHSF